MTMQIRIYYANALNLCIAILSFGVVLLMQLVRETNEITPVFDLDFNQSKRFKRFSTHLVNSQGLFWLFKIQDFLKRNLQIEGLYKIVQTLIDYGTLPSHILVT